ncbi:hypothetical protein EW145_g5784 [Phellinidium pouzarii]|uniref:Transcription and mRNA export factor SUS1 n=1 Tax=Phellinidium pouzarii TaxID=167371 RepID=A0A4S4KZ26_9AGAM|nr:hypothetical protein EW145_g5784 [Phellinidium pouzarii]
MWKSIDDSATDMAADSTYGQIHRRMVDSGEWDTVFSALVARLNESGWIDELKHSAKAQARGGVQFRDLLAVLQDQGMSSVPLAVKQEISNMIRNFVDKQFE